MDAETLAGRATLLENVVYEVTSSKADYIQRLQRDLSVLSNKKENEKKIMRQHMQQACDQLGQYAQEDVRAGAVPPSMTADAKAKFMQKLHVMEKKHQNKLSLLKIPDERLKPFQYEQKMKELLKVFKEEHLKRDTLKGPFEIKRLNDVDEQLDRVQALVATRPSIRMAPSRDTVDKQNDRTQQIGQRLVDKLSVCVCMSVCVCV